MGKFEGEYRSCYKNGRLRERGAFRNDQRDGEYEAYDRDGRLREKALYRNGKLVGKFMTLAMLQEMSNSGLVTIGSHTKNHFYLPKIKDDQFLWEEIRGSKEVLEKILHKPVEAFCYPIGGSTPRTEDVVRKAGYRVAVAISSSKGKGANNIYALSRIKMTKETANPIVLFLKLSGYYSRLRALEER